MTDKKSALPFSGKFQAGLINLLVTDFEFFRSIIDDLSEKHFDQGEAYVKLVRLIKKYWTKNQTILSIDIVKNYLIKLEQIDVISGPEHHGMLQILEAGRLLPPAEYQYIKDNTADFLKKQTVALAFGEAISAYEVDNYDKMYEIMEIAYRKSYGIGDSLGRNYAESSVIDDYNQPARKNLWSSGFPQLDSFIDGGMATSESYMLLSPSGRGKSAMLCNFAVSAIKQKKKTSFITLEMSELSMVHRIDSIQSGFSSSETTASGEIQIEVDKLRRKHSKNYLTVKEFCRGSLSISGLRNYLDKLSMTEGKPDVVIVDWIGCLKLPSSSELRYDEILASASDSLVNISREYDCTVITASQTNRSAIANEEFGYGAISGSYAAVFGQDLVLTLGANDTSKSSGRRKLGIAKNRMGPDSVYISLLGDLPGKPITYRFRECPPEEEEADLLTEQKEDTRIYKKKKEE